GPEEIPPKGSGQAPAAPEASVRVGAAMVGPLRRGRLPVRPRADPRPFGRQPILTCASLAQRGLNCNETSAAGRAQILPAAGDRATCAPHVAGTSHESV